MNDEFQRGRFPIGNCRVVLDCPKLWNSLAVTGEAKVRHCDRCAKPVFLCNTRDEVEANVRAGNCIAIAVGEDQRPMFVGRMEHDYSSRDPLDWTEKT